MSNTTPAKVRQEKFERERHTRQLAALGLVSLPGEPTAKGEPGQRIPATLQGLALDPKAWVSWLADAMVRSGKGFRVQTQKRRPPTGASRWRGERRSDKVEEARREAAAPVERGKINFRRSDRVAGNVNSRAEAV